MTTITLPAAPGFDLWDTDGEPAGFLITLPPAVGVDMWEADGTPAISGDVEWTQKICEKDYTNAQQLPGVVPDDITETLCGITSGTSIVPYRGTVDGYNEAAQRIEDKLAPGAVLPDLETQVWRGDQLITLGPLTKAEPDQGGDAWRLSYSDPAWWLAHRVLGKLGQGFGGSNGDFPDHLVNPRFTDGLAGWRILHTTHVGDYPTFGPVDPGVFTVAASGNKDGAPMLVCDTPTGDPNDTYQLYQDLIVFPTRTRPVKLRLSCYVRVRPDKPWAPTNQTFGALLTWMPLVGVTLPGGYYTANQDIASDYIDAETTFVNFDDGGDTSSSVGQWVKQECELEVPAGAHFDTGRNAVMVHVAICPPLGHSEWCAIELGGDDGLFRYGQSPQEIVREIVAFAQSTDAGHDDRLIGTFEQPDGTLIDREFVYEDRNTCLGLIDDMAKAGLFDWRMRYNLTSPLRMLGIESPRAGVYRRACGITLNEDGTGNVADVIRSAVDWGSAATNLEVTNSTAAVTGRRPAFPTAQHRNVTIPGAVIESTETGPNGSGPLDLGPLATRRMATVGCPIVLTVETLPGDTRLLTGCAPGDRLYVTCTKAGHKYTGPARLVQRVFHPRQDNATLTLNVELAT